ncbi:hypothetical protein RB2083_3431 [Rhodobacteraceae bacterium HTCC2083]|nr:hypothetical protein RB2083_3431 [Rhodobacteraceae bacterium HTCC2083]
MASWGVQRRATKMHTDSYPVDLDNFEKLHFVKVENDTRAVPRISTS